MIKDFSKWVMVTLTDVWSKQPDGTLHHYDYYLNDDGGYTYNIDFHHQGQFAPVQLHEPRKIPIQQAIAKARAIYARTTWRDQPNTDY